MTIALRPFLPADAPQLAKLYRASIELLAEEDYSEDQRAAWAASADDLEVFAQKLAGALTLIALREGKLAGFACLADGKIDMLYVDPDHARNGVATHLVEALEKLSLARGLKQIETDASDGARDFFAGRGYAPFQRNTVMISGEWLANTTMKKPLTPAAPVGAMH